MVVVNTAAGKSAQWYLPRDSYNVSKWSTSHKSIFKIIALIMQLNEVYEVWYGILLTCKEIYPLNTDKGLYLL